MVTCVVNLYSQCQYIELFVSVCAGAPNQCLWWMHARAYNNVAYMYDGTHPSGCHNGNSNISLRLRFVINWATLVVSHGRSAPLCECSLIYPPLCVCWWRTTTRSHHAKSRTTQYAFWSGARSNYGLARVEKTFDGRWLTFGVVLCFMTSKWNSRTRPMWESEQATASVTLLVTLPGRILAAFISMGWALKSADLGVVFILRM